MIFYLSGTGNSLWAAKTIAKATGERLINILDKERIRTRFSLDEDERVGFCFPVHGWRPPMALRKFISQLSFDDAKPHYCFALCTVGDNIGETINILRSDLASRNIHLDSAFSLIMPESYVGLPFMDIDTPENEKRKKDKAAKDLERFIKIIGKKQKNIEELTSSEIEENTIKLLELYNSIQALNESNQRIANQYEGDNKFMRIHKQIHSQLNLANTQINHFLLEVKHQVDDTLLNNYAQINNEKRFEGYIRDIVKTCVPQLEREQRQNIASLVAQEYQNERNFS